MWSGLPPIRSRSPSRSAAARLGTENESPIVTDRGNVRLRAWVVNDRLKATDLVASVGDRRCGHHGRCSDRAFALVSLSAFPHEEHTRNSVLGIPAPAMFLASTDPAP